MSISALHDQLCLLALKLAKNGKRRFEPGVRREFYDEFFDRSHTEQYQQDLRAVLKYDELRRALRGLRRGSSILDVGCGVGETLRAIPAEFTRYGIDYSHSSLVLAKSSAATASLVGFVQASAYHLPFPPAKFDVVTCFEVLEHLEDDRGAVVEIARVLKPGGLMITSVPNKPYHKEYAELMGHLRHYSPAEFGMLLSNAGLTVTEYLNEYRRFNVAYFYIYLMLEAANRTWTRLTQCRRSLYARRLPFSCKRLYGDLIAPILAHLRRLDEPRSEEEGTFLIATRNPVSSCP